MAKRKQKSTLKTCCEVPLQAFQNMLIRAGHVLLVSVVLALIPLYIGPSGYWNSRTSCIRNWSASVCCSGGVFTIYTARNPAFLFFPSQNSSNLARVNNNAVNSINNYPLFIHHNYPLFIDVAWERHSGTFNNGAGPGNCVCYRMEFYSHRSKIKHSKC